MIKRTIVFILGFLASGSVASLADTSLSPLAGQIIDVTAGNFYFRAPTTARPGLTTFRLHSPHNGHELVLARLEDGHTAMDLVNAMIAGAPTPWAKKLGGPAFPAPGGTTNATYLLEPGKYVIYCQVRAKDGQRHFQKGMFTELTVPAGHRVPGKLPSPDVVVTEVDYKWIFSTPLTAGRHVLRVTNAGTVTHELKFIRVLPGHTAAQSLAWKPGQPRVDQPFAAITSLEPGVSIITTIDFRPGDYTVWCVTQLKHGMVQTLSIPPRSGVHSR